MAADAPGVAPSNAPPPGLAEMNQLRQGGYSDAEISQYKTAQVQKLRSAGFSETQVAEHFGDQEPSAQDIEQLVKNNLGRAPEAQLASNPVDAFFAGLGQSATGVTVTKGQTKVLPKDAPLFNQIAQGTGKFVGDLPLTIPGFIGGAAAGAAVPVAGETGVPEVLGAGAGANAAPTAFREAVLDAYNTKGAKNAQEALSIALGSIWETTKAGVEGATGALAGGVVGGKVLAATGSKLLAGGADATTNALAATAASVPLEGRIPDSQSFIAGAVIALGFHAAGSVVGGRFVLNEAGRRVQNNLQRVWAQTGVDPATILERAKTDPKLRDELVAQDVHGDPVAPKIQQIAPPDPPAPKIAPATEKPVFKSANLTPDENATVAGRAPPAPANPGVAHLPAVGGVEGFLPLVRSLEGSADDAISPAGAVGRYQIMPGTARQYGFDPTKLSDPAYNEQVARAVVTDLQKRYQGDVGAMLTAYNAGPRWANRLQGAGEGTRLEAEVDPTVHGGVKYHEVTATRDESFLPVETQKYLANARRRSGTNLPGDTGGNGTIPPPPPSGPAGEGPLALPPPERPEIKDDYSRMTNADLQDTIGENIGEEMPKKWDPRDTLTQWVSEMYSARGIDNLLLKQGLIKDRDTEQSFESLVRDTYGSSGRARHFMEIGGIDATGKKISDDSLAGAVAQMKEDGGTDLNGWVTYMTAKRAVDKESRGVETGFNIPAAKEYIGRNENQAMYERATQTFNRMNDQVLEYALQKGIFSRAQVDAMKAENPAYLRFRRIMGEDVEKPIGGKNFKTGSPTRTMEGSDRQITNPLLSTMENIDTIIKMADRNSVAEGVVALAESKLQGLGPIVKLPDTEVRSVIGASIKGPDDTTFKPYSMNPDDNFAKTYEPFLAQKQYGTNGDPRNFLFFRDGKAEVWRAKDENIARLVRGADTPAAQDVIRNAFERVAALTRAGIVGAGSYETRTVLRHQVTAFIADPLHPPPFVTLASGALSAIKQDATYWDWMAHGGGGATMQELDKLYIQREAQNALEDTGWNEKAWNMLKNPAELFHFYQTMQAKGFQAAQIGYYKMAQARGIPPGQAAMMSRKAFLDPVEGITSSFAQWWARMVPFQRIDILGVKQMAEHPLTTGMYAALAVSLPMAMLYAANTAQDNGWFGMKPLPPERQYANMPRYQKDLYYVTPEVNGVRLKLKTPPIVGPVMGGTVTRFLDFALQNDPHAFKAWAEEATQEFIPSLIPQVAEPMLEQLANKNFFTQRAIIPATLQHNSGDYQYTEATSKTARVIASSLNTLPKLWGDDKANLSPMMVDNYVRGYLGNVGPGIVKTLEGVGNKLVGAPDSSERGIDQVPFVNAFITRNPGMNAQPIQDFFDEYQKAERAAADVALASHRRNPEELQNATLNPDLMLKFKSASDGLIETSKAVNLINEDSSMNRDEKRQIIETLYSNAVVVARSNLATMDMAKKAAQRGGH